MKIPSRGQVAPSARPEDAIIPVHLQKDYHAQMEFLTWVRQNLPHLNGENDFDCALRCLRATKENYGTA